ncbi:MAG: phosphoglycerate dehydrogenase-like enzyme [Limisphaerales bacterium]|jgi:phosphoglycerate dehydrogenase-like enzyme
MNDKPANSTFRVGLTGDFYKAGKPVYPDYDLGPLEREPAIALTTFDEHHDEIAPEQLAGLNGVIVLTPRVTRHSLAQSQQLLAISRFGVGYDTVDVAACTENDVALCITTGAVDRPVAEATVGWMFALSYRMRAKDRHFREARWDERGNIMGGGLHGKTVGIVGFGGIGRTVLKMLSGLGMNPPLVFDPVLDPETVTQLGGEPVTLPDLMARSDFVTAHCPLNEHTANLISAPELELMKPDAFILNTARGGIINEDALYEALAAERIAGAALDCFADEPFTEPNRFAQLENVILASHNIAWTRELFRDIGAMASQSLIDLANGKHPKSVVNPEVFDRPSFQEKWESVRAGHR